jgi:hypothetical protein
LRYFGLKFAICLVLTAATLSGFLAAEESDKNLGRQGSTTLEVTDNRRGVSWEPTVAALTAVADRHRVGIIRVDADFHDGDHRQHVYVTSGSPGSDGAEWARDVLRPFGRSPELERTFKSFEPGDALDPRAAYQVFGPPEAALDLAARFEQLGLFGKKFPPPAFGLLFSSYALRSSGLLGALLVGLVTLTAGSVLLSSRRYAVWRLHGASAIRMMGRDARALAPFCAAAVLVSGAVISAFLLWYNGFNRFSFFARFAGTAAVTMGIIVVFSYVLAVLAVSATSVLDALKGRMRSGPAMALLYPLRVVAVLLVVPAVAGVANGCTGLVNRDSALPHADRVGELVTVTLPGYRTREEIDRDLEEAGAWLRQLDARGRAVVVKRESLQGYLPPSTSLVDTELLWVNDTFLAAQPVLDARGSRIGSAPENTVRVIIPERLGRFADAITSSVLRSFTPEALPAGVAAPRVQRLVAADEQALFVYAVNSQNGDLDGSPLNRPMVRDAVIISIPNGTPLVNNVRLASWASYNGVVLSPEDVPSQAEPNSPTRHISGMLPVSGLLADNRSAEVRRLISDALMLVLAAAVLALAAVSTCLLYARKHSRAIYAGHVAGRGFWRIHRRALLHELAIPLGVLAWMCVSNWLRAQDAAPYVNRGIPAPPSVTAPDWGRLTPAVAASVAAIVLFAVLLIVLHRRITATASSEL